MRRLITAGALAALALVAAAPAHAQDEFTVGDAAIRGPVHVRGDVAQVHARYSCDVGTHIWVSVKQNASASIDPAVAAEGAGFGGVATAWWQSHRGTFTCDGKAVSSRNMARYRTFTGRSGANKGAFMVRLREVVPGPDGPPGSGG